MSTPQYTPGPWRHYRNPDADSNECAKAGVTMKLNDVAHCDMFGLVEQEVDANIRLIAAAPELLEAAESALQVFVNQGWEHDLLAAAKLKSAILKATQP